jgi:hypothetical protein
MINRFQNSSLMEKDGEYRPLLFCSTGSDKGRPEPFPMSSKGHHTQRRLSSAMESREGGSSKDCREGRSQSAVA